MVLAVTVAVPVCVLSLAAVLAAWTCQGRRCARGRVKQPNVEEPLSECNLVSSGKTLKDLIYDMTTSGSGSGTWGLPAAPASARLRLWEPVLSMLTPNANVPPCLCGDEKRRLPGRGRGGGVLPQRLLHWGRVLCHGRFRADYTWPHLTAAIGLCPLFFCQIAKVRFFVWVEELKKLIQNQSQV